MPRRTTPDDIVSGRPINATGRDGYIICKALAYAIAAIDGLPEEMQEGSDRDDMVVLLIRLAGFAGAYGHAEAVAAHMGRKPNLVEKYPTDE